MQMEPLSAAPYAASRHHRQLVQAALLAALHIKPAKNVPQDAHLRRPAHRFHIAPKLQVSDSQLPCSRGTHVSASKQLCCSACSWVLSQYQAQACAGLLPGR